MKLICTSYSDLIPLKYVHYSIEGGRNISPGFSWSDPPERTRSFALSIIDPHPVANNWVHWLLINIPFNSRAIAEGASRKDSLPEGSVELYNTYGERGYGGPAPPSGSGPHQYAATLYALNVERLAPGRNTLLRQFLRLVEGKILEEASATGTFEQT